MRVTYALSVHGPEEIAAVTKAIQENRLAPGIDVLEFERRVAALFGKPCGIMTNSGSSANLLALELLDLPEGSEVITPALTFATTVAPLLQKKLKPVFVDVEEGAYIPNESVLLSAITPKTGAIMLPSLIGNVPDLLWLRHHTHVPIIEDSCDTLGATIWGVPTGRYSDISTTSFYGSHIITAGGGGGMLCVNNTEWDSKARVLRGWGRSSAMFGDSEDLGLRFGAKIGSLDYDAKFIFTEVGYNFQSTELNAAFGLAQLDRLPDFAAKRKKNFSRLRNFFKQYEDLFILPKQRIGVETSWLAFPLTIKTDRFTRKEITLHLEQRDIQTRPIFTGNILRQPAFAHLGTGRFPVADNVMENAFLIGCHQGLTDDQLSYVEETFTNFLK
jgi:CDP-4-dehydro-6-deoxyglucose reductase, E1